LTLGSYFSDLILITLVWATLGSFGVLAVESCCGDTSISPAETAVSHVRRSPACQNPGPSCPCYTVLPSAYWNINLVAKQQLHSVQWCLNEPRDPGRILVCYQSPCKPPKLNVLTGAKESSCLPICLAILAANLAFAF